MTENELFIQQWDKFVTRVRGKLLQQVKKQQVLTLSVAKLQLADCAIDWSSDIDENGRWLRNLTAKDPARGRAVRQVLEDMTFAEPDTGKKLPDALDLAVPVAGAAAGVGIALMADAGTLVKAVSAVAPAAVLYPVTKQVRTTVNEKKDQDLVDAYIGQLDKYRDTILGILG